MSCKSKRIIHWATYIEYTGWYALCHADKPELDGIPTPMTREWKRVNCADCKRTRSMTEMIICKCTHKEHGHEHNTGACSRCECKKFIEREVRQ